MDILSRVEGFDWDKGNIEKNWERQKVSFVGSEELFFNRPLVAAEDEIHSNAESRHYALGTTNDGRYLLIVFTIRTNKIRVIWARDMSRRERESTVKKLKK